MEIFVFFLLVAFILVLFGGGITLIWFGMTLLKDKDFFFFLVLILIGVSLVFVDIGVVAGLLTIGLKL